MNFTPELPTNPGAFWWKSGPESKLEILCEIEDEGNYLSALMCGQTGWQPPHAMGGLWCRLVPEEDLEKERIRSREYYQRLTTAFVDGRASVVEEHIRARISEGVA